jgi:hypothetical protein
MKDFTLYPEALELKQLGFAEPCLASYYHAGRRLDICEYINHGEYTVLAPTYSQAFRWFRENYGLSGWVNESFVGSSQGVISIKSEIGLKYHTAVTKLFDTYEEAELACLRKLIEIVKNAE